jgi:ribosomal protein S18 acetylase RimI-like enzyme
MMETRVVETAAAPLAFRAATTADIPAIVALVESAYRGDASRAGWTTEADLLDGQRIDVQGVAEVIAKPDSRVLLGESDGTLFVCAHIEKQGEACYFGMFSVRPDLQGGGIGKRMLDEAGRIAREQWQCTRIEMTVISVRDDLIGWYERRGFRRTAVFKPFPYGDERFGIPKRDDLRFEILERPL